MTKNMPILVRDYMSSNPINISENDSLAFVLNVFEQGHISGALVINDRGDYVGVLSKTNLLSTSIMKLLQTGQPVKVKDIMNPSMPLMVSPDTELEEAAKMMVEKRFHRLFVCDANGQAIGVISSFDVMRAFCDPAAGESDRKVSHGLDQRLLNALDDCKKAIRKS
jgi:CBS domain-containing protein